MQSNTSATHEAVNSGAVASQLRPKQPALQGSGFTDHLLLAFTWLRWNGARATERQALKLMYQMDAATLRRMLNDRGIPMNNEPKPRCARCGHTIEKSSGAVCAGCRKDLTK